MWNHVFILTKPQVFISQMILSLDECKGEDGRSSLSPCYLCSHTYLIQMVSPLQIIANKINISFRDYSSWLLAFSGVHSLNKAVQILDLK
jgi:hypothetical protein